MNREDVKKLHLSFLTIFVKVVFQIAFYVYRRAIIQLYVVVESSLVTTLHSRPSVVILYPGVQIADCLALHSRPSVGILYPL